MMNKSVISFVKFFWINFQRGFDHAYRTVTGLPRLSRSEVTPYLYVGGQYNTAGARKLKALGVTGVVNMRETPLPFNAQDFGFAVLHLPTKDLHAPTIANLEKGVAFMKNHIDQQGKVYVHCRWGEGRGPTMAAAYLIAHENLIPEDAIKQIKNIRIFINIENDQRRVLDEFWKKLASI